jgi:tripartite-type tricarboxylate transporter receptor subunit TctC
MVLFPHVYKKLDYDAVKDFTPVSQIARFQFGVVSGPASSVKTVAEMTAKAKSDPASASYGTPGAVCGHQPEPHSLPRRGTRQHGAAGRTHRLQV